MGFLWGRIVGKEGWREAVMILQTLYLQPIEEFWLAGRWVRVPASDIGVLGARRLHGSDSEVPTVGNVKGGSQVAPCSTELLW